MVNWPRCLTNSCLVLVAALAVPGHAYSQDSSDSAALDSSGWHFVTAPYAWAFGIDGDIGVGKQVGSVHESFLDIVQSADSLLAFQGHAEVQYDRIGVFFDGTYADITSSVHESGGGPLISVDLDVDIGSEMAILETGAFYRVVENYQLWNPPADVGGGTFTFDALAGARYTYLGVSVDTKLSINDLVFKKNLDGSRDWVDPFVGGRVQFGLSDSIDFLLRGDVGGFGVGSDFTWNTQGLLGYRFTLLGNNAEAWGGYRALGQDYDEGSGRKDLEWDVILHGPVIGMTVRW